MSGNLIFYYPHPWFYLIAPQIDRKVHPLIATSSAGYCKKLRNIPPVSYRKMSRETYEGKDLKVT